MSKHIFQATLSDPDVPDASAETEDDEEPGKSGDSSSNSHGQPSPLKSSKADGQTGEATEEDSASDAEDQHIPANTNSIHTTIHTIIHAKYIVHVLVCIAIRANINQHVLACITLVFGMYEMMIRANTDQIHAFFSIRANTDANTFPNTSPIQSNTDLYNLKYRPIQAPQTNAHIIVFNTCFLICQYRHRYCQNRRPRPHRSIGVSEVSELSKPYTAARLLVVGIQFLGVVRQPNFPRRRKFLERRFGGMSLHRRLLGRQNRCQCPYFRIFGLMRGRDFDIK